MTRARLWLLCSGLLALGLIAPAAASAHSKHIVNPDAQGKSWRHGVVPKRGQQNASVLSSTNNLSYGGGISDGTNNVGVTTGPPRVYLVFWGSQWGTQGTDANGNATFSGDPQHAAPYLQNFMKGIGTGGETWSGVMTQYCEGVSTGATTCPTTAPHVGYPTGGALAGVWEDTSAAAPSQASAHQLAQEAINAATHFGNLTQSSNRNTQYVIVSPTGTSPDGYRTSNFCAWHDYTGDSTMDGGGAVSWSHGMVAFTNLPYLTDVGASCGQSFVNAGSAGTLDGFSIVEGHEYAETITDQYPAGGWTDSSGSETGDKCAWISSGQGKSQDISLTTGNFAVQSTWANDYNGGSGGCEVSHPIVGDPVTVTSPGNQSTTVNQAVQSVQMTATDNGSPCSSCTYTATGLPAGVSISSSGLFSGTAPTTAGSSNVTVTATDSSGNAGSTSFTWSWLAGTAVNVTVSPASASVGIGGSQTFTASATDQYSNPTSASSVTWSSTAPGSLSTSSGASTTFTGSGAGSGTVTATLPNQNSGFASVTVTAVANPISNGGFESGTLSGWTKSGASGAENVVSSSNYPCFAGSYCAMLGLTSPTNGASNVAQTFTAPSGSSSVSFDYEVVCDDTVQYDWATATLKDVSTGRTTTILPRTCNLNYKWVKVSAALTAGHKYTLTLTNRDDNYPGDPTYTLYDGVSVQ